MAEITLKQFISRVVNLDVNDNRKEILSPIDNDVLKFNKARLVQGKTVDGRDIEYNKARVSPLAPNKKYTKAYKRVKDKKGGNTSVVDLKLSGTFQESLDVNSSNNGFDVVINDTNSKKVKAILGNYDNTLGVNNSEISEVSKKLIPTLVNQIQKGLTNGL